MREIASGKSAAMTLDLYFNNMPFDAIERFTIGRLKSLSMEAYKRVSKEGSSNRSMVNEVVGFKELNLAHFKKKSRVISSSASSIFTKRQALMAARRCFNCGICTFCNICYDFCPDLAIHIDSNSRYREIDYDYCKGCGICIEEGPRAAISWASE